MLLSSVSGAMRRSAAFLVCFLVGSVGSSLRAQTAADGYDPEVTGSVQAMVLQPDGKLIIGGAFSQIQPRGQAAFSPASGLARLNLDGTIDPGFAIPQLQNANNSQLPAQIAALALQPDGKVLVGGNFKTASGQAYLARFNSDGSLDSSFAPLLTGAVNGEVMAIALQPNAADPAGFSILIGGNFNQVASNGTSFGRSHLARLSSTGAPDAFWNPNVSAQVDAIAFEKGGKILIGGAFTSVVGVVRNHIARLLPDASGSLDPSYNPNASGQVAGIAVQSDGKAVIVGQFGGLTPQLADGTYGATVALANIARLNPDGTIDSSWTGTAASPISAVVIEKNGDIAVGGVVGTITGGGVSAITTNFARFLPDGTPDLGFDPQVNGLVNAIVEQTNGDMIIGGLFTQVRSAEAPHATARLSVARLSQGGTFDIDFNPNAFGGVATIVPEAGGTYLIGGSFTSVGGIAIRNLARVKADGSVDTTFTPSPDQTVSAIVVQPDGKIVIGGRFLEPTPSVSTTQRQYLARLNHDGSLDTDFDPEPNQPVQALLLQSNGKILVGGSFTTFSPKGVFPSVGEDFVARLNADSTVDTTFSPFASGPVAAMVIDSSGNYLIVGGSFSTFTPTASKGVTSSAPYLARLNLSDGSVDTSFAPNPQQGSTQVMALALQADGKILVGGQFSSFLPANSPIDPKTGLLVPVFRRNAVRLNKDGTIDSFSPDPDGPVFAIGSDAASGQVYLGGIFKNVAGKFQPYLARLNSDGTIDKHDTSGFSGFGVQLNGPVTAIIPLANHQFIAGGAFTQAIPFGLTTSVPASHVALFDADGSIDRNFNVTAAFTAQINTITFDPLGRVLVGGNFSNIGDTYASDLARFWGDAVYDGSFGADPNGPIYTVLVQGNAMYVGGAYNVINSQSVTNFSRIDSSGTLDTTFLPAIDGPVYASAPDASGNIIIGGSFSQVSGASHPGLARLTPLGSSAGQADSGFAPSVTGTIYAVVVQPDGNILVGGAFTAISGTPVTNLARLKNDGTLDTSFQAAVVGTRVDAIALEPDGSIVIGGLFTSAGGVAQSNFARLSAIGASVAGGLPAVNNEVNAVVLENTGSGTSDPILLGGAFTSVGGVPRNHVARVTYSGPAPIVDLTFNPNADGAVTAIAMNPDGRILLGGAFRTVGGLPRAGIARLQSTGQTAATIAANATYTAFTFTLTGEAPEVATVAFEGSSDGSNWSPLGLGTRVGTSNTWTISGVKDIPIGANGFFVHVLMDIPTSQYASRAQATWATRFNSFPVPSLISATAPAAVAGQPFYYEIAATDSPTLFAATGLPPGIALTDAAHGILSGTPSAVAAGQTYTPVITITNATGSTSVTLTITVAASASGSAVRPLARLVNLSARALVSASNPLVAGFVISKVDSANTPTSTTLLLRAIGPALGQFNVGSPLPVPQLSLIDSHSVPILAAQGWDNSAALATITASVGAFSLSPNTADTSIATSLGDGLYTMSVVSGDGNPGVALAEIYDADPNLAAGRSHLVNVSAHAWVDAADPLVGGFVVAGSGPKKLIIRGIGPALATFGVATPLADPVLTVYSGQTIIASNTQWENQQAIPTSPFAIALADTLKADSSSSGAFALTSGSADAAVEITLTPGVYTMQVTSASGGNGTALVEVYEVLPLP